MSAVGVKQLKIDKDFLQKNQYPREISRSEIAVKKEIQRAGGGAATYSVSVPP